MLKADRSVVANGLRRLAMGSPLAFLAACAVATPFGISSTGNGLPEGVAMALNGSAEDGADRARLGEALAEAFTRHSVPLSDDARYLADYAISIRDAEGGLTASADATDEDAIDWDARPRKAQLFDGCDAQRLRATLVVLDRQTGSRVYRGEGAATACAFSDSDLGAFADRLVSDALAAGTR